MTTAPNTQDASDMPRRSYSYSRFSDLKQGEGDSLRRQDNWAEHISAREGWRLDDTLRFTDRGRSAFHGRNLAPTADLTRFLDLVDRGRITKGSVLIVENIDRLSRQDVDTAHDLFRSIIRAGIWICTKTPDRVYKGGKDASFMDLLEPIWIMYVAHMESLKKSDRIAEAWQSARKAARETGAPINSPPPRWIHKTADGYTLIPERAALVKRMADLSRSGYGAVQILQTFRREGIPSFGTSGEWNNVYICEILRGRAVVGEYQPMQRTEDGRRPIGPPIPAFYPPVLGEDEWLAVQASIDRRKRKCGRPAIHTTNLFTGIVYDAETRQRLSMVTQHSHSRRVYLQRADRGGGLVDYPLFESCILDTVAQLRPEDVLEPAARNDTREHRIAELTARLTALDHRQRQLQADAADPEKDYILPVLANVSADLKITAKELETLKMESLTGRTEALAEAKSLNQIREGKSGEERRELDRRIKAALPTVIAEIWNRAERFGPRAQVTHIQIYLKGGAMRYVRLLPLRKREGVTAADWSKVDFRKLA